MRIVIIGRETAHGKKYWNTCSEGDIVKSQDTFKVSEGFYISEDASNERIDKYFNNAFGMGIEEWLRLNQSKALDKSELTEEIEL